MSDTLDAIETEIVQTCPLCGSFGKPLHDTLKDFVFDAPGKWPLARCSDRACELVWLSLRPTAKDLHKAYRSYYTHVDGALPERKYLRSFLGSVKRKFTKKFTKYYIENRFGYIHANKCRMFLLDLLAQLNPSGADALAIEGMFLPVTNVRGRLLEVGCGNGKMLRLMRELGWQVEGAEFDPVCKKMVEMQGITCSLGDIRDQRYPSSSFNAIFTGNVIEHVVDPIGFVAECSRVLKTGGYFVVITPNSESIGHRHFKCDWRGLEPPRHLQIFNLKNLSKLIGEYGFELKVARTTNRGAWYIWGMSANIRKARLCGAQTAEVGVKLISFRGLVLQTVGRLAHIFLPDCGEELIVVAVKK